MKTPTEYRGYRIERAVTTSLGHKLPGSRQLLQRIGHGTARKENSVLATDPDGYTRVFSTWAEAKSRIDNILGNNNHEIKS